MMIFLLHLSKTQARCVRLNPFVDCLWPWFTAQVFYATSRLGLFEVMRDALAKYRSAYIYYIYYYILLHIYYAQDEKTI